MAKVPSIFEFSGAEARLIFDDLTARVNSCPSRTVLRFRGLAKGAGTVGHSSIWELLFRPDGACSSATFHPRFAPWAAFFRRFAAATRSFIFAPMGLAPLSLFTHGLRGLHSFAASRL